MSERSALTLRPRALLAIVAVTLVGIGAFSWPLLIGFSAGDSGHTHDAPWIFLVMLPLLIVVMSLFVLPWPLKLALPGVEASIVGAAEGHPDLVPDVLALLRTGHADLRPEVSAVPGDQAEAAGDRSRQGRTATLPILVDLPR